MWQAPTQTADTRETARQARSNSALASLFQQKKAQTCRRHHEQPSQARHGQARRHRQHASAHISQRRPHLRDSLADGVGPAGQPAHRPAHRRQRFAPQLALGRAAAAARRREPLAHLERLPVAGRGVRLPGPALARRARRPYQADAGQPRLARARAAPPGLESPDLLDRVCPARRRRGDGRLDVLCRWPAARTHPGARCTSGQPGVSSSTSGCTWRAQLWLGGITQLLKILRPRMAYGAAGLAALGVAGAAWAVFSARRPRCHLAAAPAPRGRAAARRRAARRRRLAGRAARHAAHRARRQFPRWRNPGETARRARRHRGRLPLRVARQHPQPQAPAPGQDRARLGGEGVALRHQRRRRLLRRQVRP